MRRVPALAVLPLALSLALPFSLPPVSRTPPSARAAPPRPRPPHPALGMDPAAFAAAYGPPSRRKPSAGGETDSYGRCPGMSYPPIIVGFVADAAFLIAVYSCKGPVPADWLGHAKAYLPADAVYTGTSVQEGTVYRLYTSRSVAEALPGAACGTSGVADGQLLLGHPRPTGPASGIGVYVVGVVSCLQPAR